MSVNINFSRLINYVYFSQLLVLLAVGVVGGPMGNVQISRKAKKTGTYIKVRRSNSSL